jgi:hypothetical protein
MDQPRDDLEEIGIEARRAHPLGRPDQELALRVPLRDVLILAKLVPHEEQGADHGQGADHFTDGTCGLPVHGFVPLPGFVRAPAHPKLAERADRSVGRAAGANPAFELDFQRRRPMRFRRSRPAAEETPLRAYSA